MKLLLLFRPLPLLLTIIAVCFGIAALVGLLGHDAVLFGVGVGGCAGAAWFAGAVCR